MIPATAVRNRPVASALATAAHELRALYGSHAAVLLLKTGLTAEHPRNLIASGVQVFDAQDTELSIPWATLHALMPEHAQLPHGCAVSTDSEESYLAALGEAPFLRGLIGEWLLAHDTPSTLVHALHAVAGTQSVGWARIELPTAQERAAGPEHPTLRQETEAQVQLELQTEFIGLDDARAAAISARMVNLVLGQIMSCGQEINVMRAATGPKTGGA